MEHISGLKGNSVGSILRRMHAVLKTEEKGNGTGLNKRYD